jgi:hypothetical protein
METQDLDELHASAMDEFDEIQEATREEREQCLQDRRFYSIAGAQWEDGLRNQFENRPKFEFNKIHLSIMKIISEYRNNAMSVNFISKDGSSDDDMAEICNSLFRSDEQDSVAAEAYDNAFEEAIGGGFGAMRLLTEYCDDGDEDNDEQRIRIEPIFDADTSVYFDLNAKRQDKSDAQSCYVLTAMSPRAYEAEYDEPPVSMPKETGQYGFDWTTQDVVYVAELFKVETKKVSIFDYKGLDGTEKRFSQYDFDDDEGLAKELKATGWKKTREKKVTKKAVHKYIINGAKVLEDCGIIVGENIPIIPVYGKRWFIENLERCMGHVRLAKDPQRLKNMQISQLAILSSVSQTEKPIFYPEQITGHEMRWAEDNLKNNPFLLVNSMTDVNGNTLPGGPVGYTKPPVIAPALGALLTITDMDIKEILGGGNNNEEVTANLSGVAVESIHQRQDMQSFIYLSNMSKAVQRLGEVWLSMAKRVFIEPGRKLKAIDQLGETTSVELFKQAINKTTGVVETQNDIAAADFDVAVEVGPSSSSRKQSTVRTVMAMMPLVQDPEVQQALSLLAATNMEGEGIGEFKDYLRKRSVQMGIVKPNEEEAKEMAEAAQNQQPDANAEYLKAAAAEAEAKATKARADVLQVVANSELTKAKTAETLAGIDLDERQQALDAAQQFGVNAGQQGQQLQQPPNQIPQATVQP